MPEGEVVQSKKTFMGMPVRPFPFSPCHLSGFLAFSFEHFSLTKARIFYSIESSALNLRSGLLLVNCDDDANGVDPPYLRHKQENIELIQAMITGFRR